MENEDNDPIMLYKLITGELVIGILDKDLTEDSQNAEVLFIKHPAVIGVNQNSFYVARYNQFSKLNMVMIMVKNVVYVDMPDDKIITHYIDLIKPKVPDTKIDDEGAGHSVH